MAKKKQNENIDNKKIMLSVCKTIGYKLKSGVSEEIYEKSYTLLDGSKYTITLNFSIDGGYIDYGKDIQKGRGTTCNFHQAENAVVLECVDRLLEKGYRPSCIELEHVFSTGHGGSGSGNYLDILIKREDGTSYMMIECKVFGKDYEKEYKALINNDNSTPKKANQLISYFDKDKNADVVILYTSQVKENEIEKCASIIFTENLKDCKNSTEVFEKWSKEPLSFGVFEKDILPYNCRDFMYRGDLEPLTEKLSGQIFHSFLEILRHNGISDKPNAFNKILNLFLCKIVDEQKNADEHVELYWTSNTTYKSMQKVLESLYKRGMSEFLRIETYDEESDGIRQKLTLLGVPNDTINEVCTILDDTKLYKSSEFAFKDIYNEDTFYENAKVVKEIVQLIQPYQFRYGHKQQFLGVFFENLLATSIKQEVGQFFTPVPIAKFMISSFPLNEKLKEKVDNCKNPNHTNTLMPTAIDYSCGSGHFLTEFMDIVQQVIDDFDTTKIGNIATRKKFNIFQSKDPNSDDKFAWVDDCIYGIEKDYRLVKTTKISTFMNGDGDANVIHADGLTAFNEGRFKNYELLQKPNQFDYVIANPPYSVSGFKNELTNTNFSGYKYLSDKSGEIECLFIERTAQLLKDGGLAAVVLPTAVISNNGIYEDARENIIKYFYIRAIAKMGKNTFMATNVETVILFLEKRPNSDYDNAKLRVEKFMNDYEDFSYNGMTNIIRQYAESHDLTFEDYISILQGNPTDVAKESDYYRLRNNTEDGGNNDAEETEE